MRVGTDDRRHSQLTKGHRPGQVQVDALERGVGRLAFGATQVQEMTSQTALTDFTMGDRVSGAAWSLNPYVGCLHSCRYCYVPNTMHLERSRWGSYVVVKHNLPTLLRKELEERPRLTVFVSTSTDPYQSIEQERRITRSCLLLLARHDWPVDILTRSPLVLRDLDVLRRFRELRVGLSVPTLDEEARRLLEPNAPPIRARLDALRRLSDAGLTTYANYAPAYPPTGGATARDIASTFQEAGVEWVNTSAWRYQSGYLAGMWDGLRRTQWAQLARFVGNSTRQESFRRELQAAFGDVGLRLRTGFFNPPFDSSAKPGPAARPLETFPEAAAAIRPCS